MANPRGIPSSAGIHGKNQSPIEYVNNLLGLTVLKMVTASVLKCVRLSKRPGRRAEQQRCLVKVRRRSVGEAANMSPSRLHGCYRWIPLEASACDCTNLMDELVVADGEAYMDQPGVVGHVVWEEREQRQSLMLT